MFDRAVAMAVMKLGQGKKFKNSRADIKLAACVVSELDREQDEYCEEEGLSL